MPIIGRFGSLAGLGSLILPGGAMESIATVTVGSGGASSIEFTSLPTGFQHLQIRGVARYTVASASTFGLTARFNGDSGSNYAWHVLFGNGSTAAAGAGSTQTFMSLGQAPGGSATTSAFSGVVIDILDYASTSKAKTVRGFAGYDGNDTNGIVVLRSGLWTSTNAVTSISLDNNSGYTFAQHSTLALYGLRAP